MIVGYPVNLPHPTMGEPYTADPRNQVTIMSTGRPRTRRMDPFPLEVVDARWAFKDDEFELFERWVRVNLVAGTLTFELQGAVDTDFITRKYAFFPAGDYAFTNEDNFVLVTATLEIMEHV